MRVRELQHLISCNVLLKRGVKQLLLVPISICTELSSSVEHLRKFHSLPHVNIVHVLTLLLSLNFMNSFIIVFAALLHGIIIHILISIHIVVLLNLI